MPAVDDTALPKADRLNVNHPPRSKSAPAAFREEGGSPQPRFFSEEERVRALHMRVRLRRVLRLPIPQVWALGRVSQQVSIQESAGMGTVHPEVRRRTARLHRVGPDGRPQPLWLWRDAFSFEEQ